MTRRKKHTPGSAKHSRLKRKPLALPYSTPPAIGQVRFDPSLHTAAELMGSAHSTAA